mmetsp:Transcript_15925/g.44023  ORF Transcript_15925/g.44023 Transcript_15925/m.44023 type:complete len:685 (-) Transcript_15925:178-2232(-)
MGLVLLLVALDLPIGHLRVVFGLFLDGRPLLLALVLELHDLVFHGPINLLFSPLSLLLDVAPIHDAPSNELVPSAESMGIGPRGGAAAGAANTAIPKRLRRSKLLWPATVPGGWAAGRRITHPRGLLSEHACGIPRITTSAATAATTAASQRCATSGRRRARAGVLVAVGERARPIPRHRTSAHRCAPDNGGGGGSNGGRGPQVVPPPAGVGGDKSRGRTPRDQIEAQGRMAQVEKIKCHLHQKPKKGCKFCKKHQDALEEVQQQSQKSQGEQPKAVERKRKPDRAISEERGDIERVGPLELANPKTFGFGGLMQTHIVECAHFKSLVTMETLDQMMEETYQFANSVEPYMNNSGTLPSALFCCLYRFFTMNLDARSLRRLIESQVSPFIRCCGLLYVRFGLPHDQLLSWCGEYLLDDEPFKPSPESDFTTTIGEFVESLCSQDKYYSTVFPRLPMATKRRVEEELAPLGQNRKRMKANKAIIETLSERGMRVECNMKGEWRPATTIELEDDPPSRPKVRVRLDDGSEEYVHLGKIIVADPNVTLRARRGRSRSRSKHDWSRDKGRTDKDLVDELRSRDREKAVATGKDYARKPVGYKAACALPREQGTASYKLMEEETFVPLNRQKSSTRSPSPQRAMPARQSQEHAMRMQQLFEKYGSRGNHAGANSGASGDVDQPDLLRFG